MNKKNNNVDEEDKRQTIKVTISKRSQLNKINISKKLKDLTLGKS